MKNTLKIKHIFLAFVFGCFIIITHSACSEMDEMDGPGYGGGDPSVSLYSIENTIPSTSSDSINQTKNSISQINANKE